MVEMLLVNAGVLVAVVLVLWAISVKIDDVSFIDSFWGGGMALMAFTSWLQLSDRGALAHLLLAMTAAWGLRLAIYLLRRWRAEGQDKRYERMLRKDREKGRFALAALTKVWLGQALLLFLVSSPAQVGILSSGPAQPIAGIAWLGIALYLVGITFEWVGDWQLSRFKADPANKGEVMDSGLWRYTRHPNYFGDACAWWGIWLVAASVGWEVAAWTVAGPLFLTFTLVKWSGAALLEKGMKHSRPGYEEYKKRTSAFIPMPPKKTA
jgi:steroid 5-alpha reductase family enzyme